MAAYQPRSNQAQDVVRCKYCENSVADYYCKNCRDKMCQKCYDEHKKHSSFSSHVIVLYNERQFAGEHCMEHPSQFYNAGCKDCNTPICPECKLKYHFSHKDTSIAKVCESARKKVKTNLKRMEARQCRVNSYISEGVVFGSIQDFSQIKVKLESRALELKACVENILSKSLAEVENLEGAHQKRVHDLIRERAYLGERVQMSKHNLNSMGPIELAFYEKKNMNWNQTSALEGLRILRFNPRPFKEDDMINFFGCLSFDETNAGEEKTDVLASRPYTAEPRPRSQELQPPRIPVPHTDRSHKRRPISASFVSPDNMKRYAMGICESPIQIKEFKSCINILFQITYSEQLSRAFISGDKPSIYTYKNVLDVRDVESKMEVLDTPKEPQGLAIGLKGNLVYSDGFNGVVEIEPHVIDANQQRSVVKIQYNARIYTRIQFI